MPQTLEEPFSQSQEETVEMIQLFSARTHLSAHERGDHSPGAHLGAYTDCCASATDFLKEIVEIMHVLVPPTLEEIVEMIQSIDALVLQSQEKTVEVIQLSPQGRIWERTQINAPVPQILREIVDSVGSQKHRGNLDAAGTRSVLEHGAA